MQKRKARKKDILSRFILVLCLMLIFLFPLYWMFSNGLKTNKDVMASPPVFIFLPTFENIIGLFSNNDFFEYFINSVIIAMGSTLIGLVAGLPASYAIAKRKNYKMARNVLSIRMIPFISFLIPWFLIFRNLGLSDTHLALILTHIVITMPVMIWIMVGFFEDIPDSLEESAIIDGCSIMQIFIRIALPIVRPGIVAGTILSVIYSWNNFMFALVLGGPRTKTMPVAIYNFMTFGQIDWAGLSAAATIITFPVLVFALFIQKYFTEALASSGMKG